ncbi:MFS transporter [Hydrocarboniphaga effusa]|uniref:MFS transporter n=1 Tax=Hydrocarboniphaga effusa TaxID=243629 RepID=UPI003BAD722A
MQRLTEPAWYRWYVLFVMTVIYAFNYVDRQIVTILAPYLKADLQITDAQLGLLYGTAFALFYGLFGIPLARLADGWSRVRTLSAGLSFWSAMTAFSGAAGNFTQLGLARIGVGVGEASASPAAVSLLGDYFERSRRGTVLALYSVGIYVGSGASLMIGGSIVAAWESRFGGVSAPLGLAGWQASFIAVGLPGLVLALLVLLTVREPVRGRLESRPQANDPAPFRSALRELGAMFPPWNFARLRAMQAPARELHMSLAWLLAAVVLVIVATWATNASLSAARRAVVFTLGGFPVTTNLIQWIAMGLAFYACASWFQSVRLSDPVADRLITGSRTFRALVIAGACLAFSMNAVTGFNFVYATRYLQFDPQAGLTLGVIAVFAGGLGISASGVLCDWARRRHVAGRLYFVCCTASLFTLASVVQYSTQDAQTFYLAYAAATFFVPMWFGPVQATTQDLVIPRLRGSAFAVLSLGPNIVGLGLGPYTVGLISDATGDLRFALYVAVSLLPAALVALFYAARHLAADEAVAATIAA